jgi:transcription termination factor Rho
MSSVLDRSALEESPLADLHLLANELGVDGFRRLRKAELIDAIVAKQGGDGAAAAPTTTDEDEEAPRPRRSRGGRGRGRRTADDEDAAESTAEAEAAADRAAEEEDEETPSRRRRRGGRRGRDGDEPREEQPEHTVEGVVELLGNGSGFVRLSPPEPTDEDVYISAAQVKRCELVSGDRIAGPARAPRRSERFPSLVRIDTINDRPADEVAEGTRFDDLPAAFPTERLAFGEDDPTVKAIEWLTPIGRGSRVTIVGPARSGKSEALRRLGRALVGQDGLELSVVLAGVRPEEVGEWGESPKPLAALSFAASADTQAQAVESAVEQGRRVASRGSHAVVLIDSLEHLTAGPARRVLAAARNIPEGGSLTIVATAPAPIGGETTVIALDPHLTAAGRFPALDLGRSGTMRPELLVGDAGAQAIAKARAEAAEPQRGE